jgi:hypothetical protein
MFNAAIKNANAATNTTENAFCAGISANSSSKLSSNIFKEHLDHLNHCDDESSECN